MWAIVAHAVEFSMELSQSLANLRHLPSQAKVRSTTHLRGRTAKPSAVSERLMISMVHWPCSNNASFSLSPAEYPSGQVAFLRSWGFQFHGISSSMGLIRDQQRVPAPM